MATYTIPTLNISRTFEIVLAGKIYTMTCRFNDAPDAGWVINMTDANTGAFIAANIPLITGADLLEGLEYLGFGGMMLVVTDGNTDAVPTFDNLGIESELTFTPDVDDGQ